MTFVILWLLLSIGAGAVASAKGRSGFGYFLLAVLLSPLVGLIIAACMPSLMYVDAAGVRRRVVTERETQRALPDPDSKRREFVLLLIIVAVVIGTVVIVNVIMNP